MTLNKTEVLVFYGYRHAPLRGASIMVDSFCVPVPAHDPLKGHGRQDNLSLPQGVGQSSQSNGRNDFGELEGGNACLEM